MIRKLCLTVLLVFLALPAYAGHGSIRETDTQIFIEYTGDDNEILASNILKKEEQKKEAEKKEAEKKTTAHKQAIAEMKAARAAENRKEEE